MAIYLKQFTKFPNAGDVASGFVISRLLALEIVLSGEARLNRPNLVAIGSILHWADEHSIVWGSGLISATTTVQSRPATVAAVRGHLTKECLDNMGIQSPTIIGDPGIVISDLFCAKSNSKHGVGIIPHYVDLDHPFVVTAQERGAVLISPLSPLESYLTAVASCDVIITSSLHGIVFAHSFGVPAAWIKLSSKVIGDGFKFRDYYSSIGFAPNEIPALTEADAFERVVDHATLPRSQIDRQALRDALLAVADRLEEHSG